ncbi:MAG: hypothetical protein AAGG44_08890, partial [Planctomycetota bacterium]
MRATDNFRDHHRLAARAVFAEIEMVRVGNLIAGKVLLCLSFLLGSAFGLPVHANDEIVVVRPSAWASALDDWKTYRATQGYAISEIDAELGQPEILKRIRVKFKEQTNPTGTKFLMLVGDVDPRTEQSIPT